MEPYDPILNLINDFKIFFGEFYTFAIKHLRLQFLRFEDSKGILTWVLYRQRGKWARRLTHSGMASLAALGVMIAPVVAQEFPGRSIDPWQQDAISGQVLSAFTEDTDTEFSNQRDSIIIYEVQEGDTISSIAQKFGITQDTIRWQNNLKTIDSIKLGQKLEILPVSGIAHKVKKGDTIESIAKHYDSEAQAIVDFPFNSFTNDETFELAIGQTVYVPDGVKPQEQLWQPIANSRQTTPNAGSVTASGTFVWPTQGIISQKYAWYHPGLDIANRASPNVLAADSGKVVAAGWDSTGYGNRVIIDHGNGFKTLYAHMQKLFVVVGQTVKRGNPVGQMGSTGRSTGTHLHFEIHTSGGKLNPLNYLK